MRQKLSRGKFIGLTSGITLLALAGQDLYASVDLVATPQSRQNYTRKLLKKLCTEIGPRPSGSKAYEKGAGIIHEEMKVSLPNVSYDEFKFDKWELTATPEFILGGQTIEIVPKYGGEGTPAEGISGIIEKTESGFSLIDITTGIKKAVITVGSYGKAISGYQPRTSPPTLPTFSIGKQDVPLIERGLQNKAAAWIRCPVRIVPNSRGLNIIGSLPGKRKEEILFVAHADTVYNTPGANDNTASVIVMLMIAHAAATRGSDYTLTFVATDNEELGYLGARNYADKRIADDTMRNIRYVVNFDSLTYGPNLWISSMQKDLKEMIHNIHNDLNIKTTPIFDDKDGYVMDSEPFRSSGAKALHANSRGYDEKTLPVYHRPDDIAENVPLDCVEIGFLVFDEFVKRINRG